MKSWLILEGEKKRRFDLDAPEILIGRSPRCEIRLESDKVSREHFRIVREGERSILVDLGSRNGTEVNGRKIARKPLEWGDRIRVGDIAFVFISEETPPEATVEAAAVPDAAGQATASIVLERANLAPEDPKTWTGSASGSADALSALYEIGRRFPQAQDAAELSDALLRILLRSTPARRGAVFLGTPLVLARALGPDGEIEPPAATDDPFVQEILRKNVPVLAHRTLAGRGFSALAAPLPGAGKPQGVLYLDALGGISALEADHLPFVAAAANLAGAALSQMAGRDTLKRRSDVLEEALGHRLSIMGESEGITRLLAQIRKAASIDSPVLILGESGSGKELVARAIHEQSRRRTAPLLAVNCASIPETLAESELFGHEKGAFTGADAMRKGKFEAAHGGTIFLDEIGDLPMSLQPKMLRVLEDHRLMRVGGTKEIGVDARLIAATHRDLEAMAGDDRFRRDLLFRLRVIELRIPPLRERADDVPILARHFLTMLAAETGRRPSLASEALAQLKKYPWPGNVRELKNALERAVVLSTGSVLGIADFAFLGSGAAPGAPADPSAIKTMAEVEKEHVACVLAALAWNRSKAAAALGIDRKTLYAKIKDYGLDPGSAPAEGE